MNMLSFGDQGGSGRQRARAAIVMAYFASSAALCYGQANTARLTTSINRSIDGRPRVDKTIHNNSPVSLTAYIVSEKVVRKDVPFDLKVITVDSVTDGESKEIPAGGDGLVQPSFAEDPTNLEYRLVTALFSDGSTFGDEAWAKVFTLRRHSALQALGQVIAELEGGEQLSGTDLLTQLESSRLRLVSAEHATAQDSNNAADRLPHMGRHRDLFEEATPELKTANIQAKAEESLASFTDRCYREAAAVLALTPPGLWTNLPQQERVRRMIEKFTGDRSRVIESKPALLDTTPTLAVKP